VPGSLDWFAGLFAFQGDSPMSFSLNFVARSKSHALQLLDERKSHVPASVHSFLKAGIENLQHTSGQELRVVEVSASGHLAEDKSSYGTSSGSLSVKPIYAPD
jgi:hypothetical protein